MQSPLSTSAIHQPPSTATKYGSGAFHGSIGDPSTPSEHGGAGPFVIRSTSFNPFESIVSGQKLRRPWPRFPDLLESQSYSKSS